MSGDELGVLKAVKFIKEASHFALANHLDKLVLKKVYLKALGNSKSQKRQKSPLFLPGKR